MRLLGCILFALLLTACSSGGDNFRLEGRLRNMNQGEFWVYSPNGGMIGIDTIKVRDGRFSYELNMASEATLVIVFPNYSEQPVFAGPGEKVTIKGDATHLKEMIIQGTTENEEMTSLRMELNDLTPPEIPHAVSDFIKEHLSSPVSIYLVQRYFVLKPDPDYSQAFRLVRLMQNEQPDNQQLQLLGRQLSRLQASTVGKRLQKFSATDTKGQKVTDAILRKPLNVVSTWATWSYLSHNMLYRLKKMKQKHGERLGLLSICLDGRQEECRQRIARDSLTWPTVCDGRMWDSPLLSTFGLSDVPDNILFDGKGRVIARDLTIDQLEERINKVLQ